jgi:hypothetical protein
MAVPRSKKHHKPVSAIAQKPARVADTIARQSAPSIVHPILVKTSVDSSLVALHANITGIVYLHESPNFNSQVVAKIPDGAKVHLVHKGSAWDKVEYDDQVGYVLRSSVDARQ